MTDEDSSKAVLLPNALLSQQQSAPRLEADNRQGRLHQSNSPQSNSPAPQSAANIGCPFPVVGIRARSLDSCPLTRTRSKLPDGHAKSIFIADDFQEVWFSITTNPRWIPVNNQANYPVTLADFRRGSCLLLSPLPEQSTWEDVKKQVRIEQHGSFTVLVVQGKLQSKLYCPQVELTIAAAQDHPLDYVNLLNMIYIRVVPWELLFSAIMNIRGAPHQDSEMEAVRTQLLKFSSNTQLDTLCHTIAQGPDSARPENGPPPSDAEKFVDLAKLPNDVLKSLLDYIETGSSIVKSFTRIIKSAPTTEPEEPFFRRLKSALQITADITKGLSIVSAAFQLMAIGVQIASLARESRRGARQYPVILRCTARLFQELMKSIRIVLTSTAKLGNLQCANLRQVFQQVIDLMVKTEDELMRGRILRFLKGFELENVEGKFDDIEQKVLRISTFADVQQLKMDVEELKQGATSNDVALLSECPPLSKYFSGRTAELKMLQMILEMHGKALIAQYGGAGKTQLMVMIAEHVRKHELVPGGVFWITVDGGKDAVLSSIASFVEALSKKHIKFNDRTNRDKVVHSLKTGLSQLDGRWLICLDNADNPDGNEIIGDISEFASPEHGWVIVTSRQGARSFASVVHEKQAIRLEPLPEDTAMVVLWRWKTGKLSNEVSDEDILIELLSDEAEFSAIKLLMKKLNLSGLPLGLQNVGSYVHSAGLSFAEYLELHNGMRSRGDLVSILQQNVERGVVRDEQRAIWTTWKISIDSLSAKARLVVYILSLYGGSEIEESLSKKVVKRIACENRSWKADYVNWINQELLNNTSLMQTQKRNEAVFLLFHPLIRHFIVAEAYRVENVLNCALKVGTEALYEAAEVLMQKYNSPVSSPARVFDEDVRQLVENAKGVLEHSWAGPVVIERRRKKCALLTLLDEWRRRRKRITETGKFEWKLDSLHFFTARSLHDQFRYTEAMKIWWKLVERYDRRDASENDILSKSLALYEIGLALKADGRLEEAERALKICLELRRQLCGIGVDHLDAATALLALGLANEELGLLAEAEEMYRESLAIMQRLYGVKADHRQIAVAIGRLASVLQDRDSLSEAEEMYQKCLQMQLRLCSETEDYIDVSITMNNLALVLKDQGKLHDAEMMLQESLAIDRRIYGEGVDHLDIAITLRNLGDVQIRLELVDTAEQKLCESVAMYERMFGKDSNQPNFAGTRSRLHELQMEIKEKSRKQEFL